MRETRHTVDTITSDALDALYEQLHHLEQIALPDLRRQAERHQDGKSRWRARAERAEAAIARVRSLATATRDDTAEGVSDYDMGRHDVATSVLAAIDEPKEPTL
ncbi:hypothetical protein [Streptomyces sp. NPDC019507]|uniref:hypothetical protein n=1 Tax=Streptomyces sp. NPDC019507 TaxID=3154689 RepID=UPI0033DC6B3C